MAVGAHVNTYNTQIHLVNRPPPVKFELFLAEISLSSETSTESTSAVSHISISVPSVAVFTSTYSPYPIVLQTTDTTKTDIVTVVKPTIALLVVSETATQMISTTIKLASTITRPAIIVTQLVGIVTVVSESTTLTEVQIATETSIVTVTLV